MARNGLEQGADWLTDLARLEDDRQRSAFFQQRPDLRSRDTLERLGREILQLARQDFPRAERLAGTSRWLAEALGDAYSRGLSAKFFGNIRYLDAKYERALEHYDSSVDHFGAHGAEVEAAVTLSNSIHARILLGDYSKALASTHRAREIFERHDEKLLLARLDSNEAQIYVRQSRHADALRLFERALGEFHDDGDPQDIAAVLHNIAVCRIALSDFSHALDTYQELSTYCEQHGILRIAAQADYNVAYLYFLRGEYVRSLELYRRNPRPLRRAGRPLTIDRCATSTRPRSTSSSTSSPTARGSRRPRSPRSKSWATAMRRPRPSPFERSQPANSMTPIAPSSSSIERTGASRTKAIRCGWRSSTSTGR